MSEPTISERADAIAARAKAAGGPYRRRIRVPASMQEVVELAEVLRDHASQTEEDRVAALVQHRGPYFNGVDMRCGCGQPVSDYKDWARHAVRAPAS